MIWILVFATIAGLSTGQVLFKLGATQVNANAHQGLVAWLNLPIVAGVVLYGVCTLMWISALRVLPLRIAYPVVALSYVIVPLLSHYFLDEPLSLRSMAGSAIIIVGVAVASYSG